MAQETLLKPEGRVLPTLEADGSRRWLFPRLALGKFLTARRAVAYGLILIFTVTPFISIGGKPAVLFDLAGRKLTLFGHTFLPTDTFLLALLAVSWVLSIFLVTALFGRAWCGWTCPQTVYMEFVFRPVERLFLGRSGQGGKPKAGLSPLRYIGMYLAFLLISLYLAHTALSYFVGVEQLRVWMTQSPANHPWGFFIIVLVTGGMMLDFAYFREQTCLIACPYGRFQSVLIDRNSRVVRYDVARGEPRKGLKDIALPVVGRSSDAPAAPTGQGHCISCTMCVQVCPTGIDIRDGLQFECINCTQCMDACDEVMSKVGKPTGLIRYASLNQLAGQPSPMLRPRIIAYTAAMVGLLTILVIAATTMKSVDVWLVRNQGLPFITAPDGRIENTMRLQLASRSEVPVTATVTVPDADGVALLEDKPITLKPGEKTQLPLHFLGDASAFPGGRREVEVVITTSTGDVIRRACVLFGPAGK
jgi:cytochrome c oxidase accessory protein FixG